MVIEDASDPVALRPLSHDPSDFVWSNPAVWPIELWAGEGRLTIFTSNSSSQKGLLGFPVLAGISNGVLAVKTTWFGEVLSFALAVVHPVGQSVEIVLSPV